LEFFPFLYLEVKKKTKQCQCNTVKVCLQFRAALQ